MSDRGVGWLARLSRCVIACCLSHEGLVDVGDAFFVAGLVQVLKRGEVGQVGLEFVTERWPDGSGIAIRGLSYQMVWSLIIVGTKEELGAEIDVVLLDRHDLGLVMKMELQCHDVTTVMVRSAAFCFLWRSLQRLSLRVGVQMGAAWLMMLRPTAL